MNIIDATKYILLDGGRAGRTVWRNHKNLRHGIMLRGKFIACYSDRVIHQFVPDSDDLIADDWERVNEVLP